MTEITKEQFDAYRKVQYSGKYNMFDPMVVHATGLDKATYMEIMKQYENLKEKYGEYEGEKQ